MNRYRVVALGTVLMFTASLVAPKQQTGGAKASEKSVPGVDGNGLPSVETQLKVLTEKLGLTSEQQPKVRTILRELHDGQEKLEQDRSLSQEQRLAKVRPMRYGADEKIRALLTVEQKKKLDAYEQGPHGEMHGNLSGAKPSQPPNI